MKVPYLHTAALSVLSVAAVSAACLAGPVDLASIYAPEVVAVQPIYAVHDLCRTADGEIRHYGWQMVKGKKRRVYIASRDEGLSWKTFLAEDDEAGYMEKSPESGCGRRSARAIRIPRVRRFRGIVTSCGSSST